MSGKDFIHLFRKLYIPIVNSEFAATFHEHRGMSDEKYIRRKFKKRFGRFPDLNSPTTFNEKLQWMKLYDRRPIYTQMVDKYAVRDFVKERIGEEYLIPMLGVWDSPEQIDFSSLPDRFVLKPNHDSGSIVICKDKKTFDAEKAVSELKKTFRHNYYLKSREWPYKDVKKKIIAEEYVEDSETHELRDYKFLTFGGVPKIMFIATERQNKAVGVRFDFFDMEFNHLPIISGPPNADVPPAKPAHFDLMKELAKKLAEGTPQVRVDFYEANGKVYFGEMTLFHHGGFCPFVPDEWDRTLGDWISLPEFGETKENSQ